MAISVDEARILWGITRDQGPGSHLIVAHRLLESRMHSGPCVGDLIAQYAFRFADGTELILPIRDESIAAACPYADKTQAHFLESPHNR
jgi:hypothetical protein